MFKKNMMALVLSAVLVGCGGVSYQSITGLAATGAALAGAAVTAKCASGPTMTGTTSAEGAFTLALSNGQTMPCMLQVVKGDTTLHSIAMDSGRNNVTPLSDLVVTKALGSDAVAAFAGFDAAKGAAIKAGLEAAKAYVKAQVTDLTGGHRQVTSSPVNSRSEMPMTRCWTT